MRDVIDPRSNRLHSVKEHLGLKFESARVLPYYVLTISLI